MKKLSFITQFKIEFLLPFTVCRKEPGKMPDLMYLLPPFILQNFKKNLRAHPES